MKKLLIKVLLFIPFVIFLYALLVLAWGSFVPQTGISNLNYNVTRYAHMGPRVAEVRQTRDVDILFLGASFTYRGFDPRIFSKYGYKTFNLGSSNQTPIQTKLLLDRYLKNLNPKLIIYEVNPRTFMFDGVESSLDLIANDSINSETLNMALTLNSVKTYNTLMYAYFLKLLNKDSNRRNDTISGDDKYVRGGYVERKVDYNDDWRKYPGKRWKPIPYQMHYFESILELIRKNDIQLCLVQAPLTRVENQIFLSDSSLIENFFNSKTATYFNFNNLLEMDDRLHFMDSRHLNQDGVQIFNEAVIKKIHHLVKPSGIQGLALSPGIKKSVH